MLSISLIQFSVDGWSYVPSLLFQFSSIAQSWAKLWWVMKVTVTSLKRSGACTYLTIFSGIKTSIYDFGGTQFFYSIYPSDYLYLLCLYGGKTNSVLLCISFQFHV